MTPTASERIDTVIIGAGQAGLAVGYHLARRYLPFVIVDAAERVGDSWRARWDSLRVFTPARYNHLPGSRFPGPASAYPTKDEVADYLEGYARRFDLPVRAGVRVDRVWRRTDRYVLSGKGMRLEAANVVVATGPYRTPHVPDFAPKLDPNIVQLHSNAYRNPSQLQPGPVLVVGAGNSGAEIALDIRREGHPVWLSGRDVGQELPFRHGSLLDRLVTPPLWLLFSRLLTTSTPVGRRFRDKVLTMGGQPLVRVRPKDLAAAGIERVPRTAGNGHGHPRLDDGRVLQPTNVIWATGFRPDFDWIDLPIYDELGNPIHDRGVITSQPGLYFLGLFFLHTLTSALIGGVGRDARHIAQHIRSRQPTHTRSRPSRSPTVR